MKNQIMFSILGIIFIIYFTVYALIPFYENETPSIVNVCTTQGCLKAAESIKNNMNISHKPCDNFYLFACGKFVKGANVPKGQGYTDAISRMTFEIQKKLKESIEKEIHKHELRSFRLLRSYYKSCLTFNNFGWRNCIDYVMVNMPLASGSLFVRKYFNETLKTDVLEITNNLHKIVKKVLSEVSWMTSTSKRISQEKLELMSAYVAYPEELFDDEKLDNYFARLPDPTDNFIENRLALERFNYEIKLQYPMRYFDIFAGFLQDLFIAPGRPNYLNYGGIGHVIAREMINAFDNSFIQVDEKRNSTNWWDSETIIGYKNNSKCFVDQYSQFKASKRKIPLNGKYTLKENIADNSGFKVAYRAYKEWEKENGQEPGLPGLSYTSRQLFWIGAANTMCTRFRRKGWDIFLAGKRSPAPFRILGSFSNIEEFASDFGCPLGSRMNPAKKCSLW